MGVEVYKTEKVDSKFGKAFVTVSEVDPTENYKNMRFEIQFHAEGMDLAEIPSNDYRDNLTAAKERADEAVTNADNWMDIEYN